MAKNDNSFLFVLIIIVVFLAGAYFLLNKNDGENGKDDRTEVPAGSSTTSQLTPEMLEIPVLRANRPEQVIAHYAYTVSYNPDWCVPNWVAYELTREETRGNVPRAIHFEPDPDVKGVCPTYRDYSRSDYTRGHMAPAGDMKWDTTAMRESFYLSNVCPQDENLNDGDWKELEEMARVWADRFGSVYIVCGPIMSGNPETIGRNHVAVPDAFFKVLLCQLNGNWQAIGFVFENKPGHKKLIKYGRTVDEVEQLTGIDFFPALDDEIENVIEAKADFSVWNL